MGAHASEASAGVAVHRPCAGRWKMYMRIYFCYYSIIFLWHFFPFVLEKGKTLKIWHASWAWKFSGVSGISGNWHLWVLYGIILDATGSNLKYHDARVVYTRTVYAIDSKAPPPKSLVSRPGRLSKTMWCGFFLLWQLFFWGGGNTLRSGLFFLMKLWLWAEHSHVAIPCYVCEALECSHRSLQ